MELLKWKKGSYENIVKCVASTKEHESRQGTGAIWGHKGLIKTAGVTGVKGIFQVCESIKQEGEIPEQWGKSYTEPVYNGNGDVLLVDKFRGVRLVEWRCIIKP